MPHADPEHAPSKPLDESVNSIPPTAKQGTRRTSDRFKPRKPTVLQGGITKAKAKVAKPTINGSRSVSTKTASATTANAPAISRVRPRADTVNAQSKQQTAGSSIKSNNAQKSSIVLSNDGGAVVGGLANTLMSYGLRITDSLAR